MTLEAILIWIVIGAVAGWLASLVMKGGSFGLISNIVLGIIGAFVGGWLLGQLGVAFGGLLGSIFTAFVGAVVLLAIARIIKRA